MVNDRAVPVGRSRKVKGVREISPHPYPSPRGEGIFFLWAGYPGWRAFGADPGLICCCPFGAAVGSGWRRMGEGLAGEVESSELRVESSRGASREVEGTMALCRRAFFHAATNTMSAISRLLSPPIRAERQR